MRCAGSGTGVNVHTFLLNAPSYITVLPVVTPNTKPETVGTCHLIPASSSSLSNVPPAPLPLRAPLTNSQKFSCILIIFFSFLYHFVICQCVELIILLFCPCVKLLFGSIDILIIVVFLLSLICPVWIWPISVLSDLHVQCIVAYRWLLVSCFSISLHM